MRVNDGSGQAVFVIFDGDMNTLLEKHCHELVSVPKVGVYNQLWVCCLLCTIE
jgi:hypothetical protein